MKHSFATTLLVTLGLSTSAHAHTPAADLITQAIQLKQEFRDSDLFGYRESKTKDVTYTESGSGSISGRGIEGRWRNDATGYAVVNQFDKFTMFVAYPESLKAAADACPSNRKDVEYALSLNTRSNDDLTTLWGKIAEFRNLMNRLELVMVNVQNATLQTKYEQLKFWGVNSTVTVRKYYAEWPGGCWDMNNLREPLDKANQTIQVL
jgi:hypothetical protein